MLNPEKYNDKISKLEKDLKCKANKIDENIEELKDVKKSNKKCFIALLLIVAMLGFVALAIFYPPLREFCVALLNLDINKDTLKIIVIILVLKAIETVCVLYASDWDFSVFLSVLAFGTISIFIYISENNGDKRLIKKQIKEIKNEIKATQSELDLILKEKEEEIKKLSETEEMFNRGVTENDLQIIQHAADLGNPNAMMTIGKQLYEQAKQSDDIDKIALEKAAKYRYANAIFEIAEIWLDESTTGLLTDTEKSELLKKVDNYVKDADFTNHPDGRILQISRQVYSTKKKDFYKLLLEVRSIKNKERLSDKYSQLADIIIKQLISEIDRLERYKKISKH